MKTAHKETHRSQEFVICKLPGQLLLVSVLGCSQRTNVQGDTGLRNVKAFA